MRRTAWGGNTLVPDRTRCGCSEVQRPDKVQGRGKEEVGIASNLKFKWARVEMIIHCFDSYRKTQKCLKSYGGSNTQQIP